MITLLIGKKGSGKTKKLIENANNAVAKSSGNVVVIEKGLKLTYDISHKARLIDTDAYAINGADAMFGFISGICAGNYDVTDIFVDSTLKIIGNDIAGSGGQRQYHYYPVCVGYGRGSSRSAGGPGPVICLKREERPRGFGYPIPRGLFLVLWVTGRLPVLFDREADPASSGAGFLHCESGIGRNPWAGG